MGAWGYKPFQNDDALDLWDGKVAPVLDSMFRRKRLNAQDRWARLGVLELIWSEHAPIDDAVLNQALQDAKDLLRDEDWLATWNEPEDAIDELKAIARKIERSFAYKIRRMKRQRKGRRRR